MRKRTMRKGKEEEEEEEDAHRPPSAEPCPPVLGPRPPILPPPGLESRAWGGWALTSGNMEASHLVYC